MCFFQNNFVVLVVPKGEADDHERPFKEHSLIDALF